MWSAFRNLRGFAFALVVSLALPRLALAATPDGLEGRFVRQRAGSGTTYVLRVEGGERFKVVNGARFAAYSGGVVDVKPREIRRRTLRAAAMHYAATVTPRLGQRKVAVLVAQYRSSPPADFAAVAESLRTVLSDGPQSVRAFYEEASYGALSFAFDVYGIYRTPSDGSLCDVTDFERALRAQAARSGVNLAAYDQIMVVSERTPDCIGLGEVPEGRTTAFIHVPFDSIPSYRHVFVHELGHTLGMGHADALDCADATGARTPLQGTCAIRPYQDRFSVMGDNNSAPMIGAWERFMLGWIGADRILTPSASGTYEVTSADSPAAEGARALRIPVGTLDIADRADSLPDQEYDLWIEFRSFESVWDEALRDGTKEGATVRLVPRYAIQPMPALLFDDALTVLNEPGSSADAEVLTVGSSMQEPRSGLRVTVNEVRGADSDRRLVVALCRLGVDC